ncbi:MAG: nucleotidyltransferase domain-containing protein [Armatimonadota bacterium]|nr:nucleotidyltransferase domain-containing protein [Armatimonadota bacterium]MDR7426071.1 nucleotidyltransferase domain-containing protein [Armatimonadota bacterium]MDR7465329.1 nucleotidyltransferase domain-containing protein [Armatimonadota bacterium]MDR7469070.1 nucleotidyltransferase domain-containing protein [Armatimonadota bacterium]MDR7474272.1 nucleotidyltransferase domain-containing protein [Armatimonadota bacterium]
MMLRPGVRALHTLRGEEREQCVQRLRAALEREAAVLFAYVFGSFTAKGPFEDIDVAVFIDPGQYDQLDPLSAQLALAARLESAVGLPVEVVFLNDAPLGLRAAALRGRLLYSRDDKSRTVFLEQTGLARMDLAFLFRESLRDLLPQRPRHP